MMAEASDLSHECPVCHEDYTEPKILPCTHLMCRNCVISWLGKGGDQVGCPLCRAPIIPPAQQGQGDVSTLVDAFLTDMATAAVVESKKALSSRHVCNCSDDVEATLFCLQCSINLCKSCAKTHAKIPSAHDHVTEELSSLTAERLALGHQLPCSSHASRPAELYCTDHKELICLLCSSSTHRKCSDVDGISEMAAVKREELKKQVERLKEIEDAVVAQIDHLDTETTCSQAKFKAMRDEVKTTFDELQQMVEQRRQALTADIQRKEDKFLEEKKSAKSDLEEQKVTLVSHKHMAERLVTSAPDCSLLTMFIKLKRRLDGVEAKAPSGNQQDVQTSDARERQAVTVGDICFDSQKLADLKKLVDAFGQLTESSEKPPDADYSCIQEDFLLCAVVNKSGLSGKQFASVSKVRDRVRRGKDWDWGNEDGTPPGLGPVTDVPSDLKTGWVNVRWDSGAANQYQMGVEDCYDLELA